MIKNTAGEPSVKADIIMPLIMERLAAGQTVRNMNFHGMSMLPMLRQEKDFVEIAKLPERLKKYDLPVYRRSDGMYVMHRVVGVQDGCYICLGDNTYSHEKILPEQMVAVVCSFTRNGKQISVENHWYRAYCRIWCALFPAYMGLYKNREYRRIIKNKQHNKNI